MRKSTLTAILTVLGLTASVALPTAQAADYQVLQQQTGDLGYCVEAGVFSRIQSKFRHQVTHVPNLPNVAIVDFQNISLTRWVPADEDRQIAQLFCRADVTLSDGTRRPIWYLVEEGVGFAGYGGYNVEFCVDGFDRWNVYNAQCRVLR